MTESNEVYNFDFSFLSNSQAATSTGQVRTVRYSATSDTIRTVASVMYTPYNETRKIMFVFDTPPVVTDQDLVETSLGDGKTAMRRINMQKVPTTVLPTALADFMSALLSHAIYAHIYPWLDKNAADEGVVFADRLPADATIAEYIQRTGFLFTYYQGFYDKEGHFIEKIETAATRFSNTVDSYRPDIIVALGEVAYTALVRLKYSRATKPQNFYGWLLPTEFIPGVEGYLASCFNPTPCVYGMRMQVWSYLAGYAGQILGSALLGKQPYTIEPVKCMHVMIDTKAKFDKLLPLLAAQPYLAIDTETTSLNRINNRLLTIQFAKCSRYGYIIPIGHKDTPFTPSELVYIKDSLRDFFEGKNSNKYHIYVNAVFDLCVLKQNLGVRYFSNDVWDIFAGEFALDENRKHLKLMKSFHYYSLFNISLQYGCDAYLTSEFGKEQRNTIETSDLTPALLEYCALDVCIPIAIHKQQMQKAADIGYDRYASVVHEQISDIIHNFATMEHNGVRLDIDYLFQLRGKDSPINNEIDRMAKSLLATDACTKANDILLKRAGVPTTGLFSDDVTRLFSLRKKEHLSLLFFDVLGLEQPDVGKSGQRKLDKKFQDKYSDVKEITMFTNLTKSQKLSNAYIKQLLKFWDSDEDFKGDLRVRPHYDYTGVVTGRTSASKPSLQQIPTRTKLGKLIKRLFIAEEGKILIKVDMSAHEVRVWGQIANDPAVVNAFATGILLKQSYRKAPTPELAKRVENEADVHKYNACFFFGVSISEVTADLRAAVKGVVFGLIYGQGVKKLSESIKKDRREAERLMTVFEEKFPTGYAWFSKIHAFAQQNLYVESPIGRRRNLFGYLVPESASDAHGVHAAMNRRAVNSVVQGAASDFAMIGVRVLDRLKWRFFNKTGRQLDIKMLTTVHDSLEVEVAYCDVMRALHYIEYSMTTGVRKTVKNRSGFDFNVDLEIDFEIGANSKDMRKWQGSYEDLKDIIKETLTFQKDSLSYDVGDIEERVNDIVTNRLDEGSPWLAEQARRLESPKSSKE
jgi:DNA polymerase I-like protein with 3'-5' exonuclease and polymerase domains